MASATSTALEAWAFSSDALAAASWALAWSRATWNGFSSITSKSWPFLTLLPSSKCRSVKKPLTRARIVTSSRARVVPIGLTMIGTVILFDSTTVTDGGGGTRSGVAVAVQPARPSRAATVEHEQARSKQELACAIVCRRVGHFGVIGMHFETGGRVDERARPL